MTEHERIILASRIGSVYLNRAGGGTALALLRSPSCVIQGANTMNAITSLSTTTDELCVL